MSTSFNRRQPLLSLLKQSIQSTCQKFIPTLTFSGCAHKSHIPWHKCSELMSTSNLEGEKSSSVEGGLFVSLLEAMTQNQVTYVDAAPEVSNSKPPWKDSQTDSSYIKLLSILYYVAEIT